MSKELEFIEDLFNRVYEATKYLEENKDTIDTTETNQSIVEILKEQNESLEIIYSIKQALITFEKLKSKAIYNEEEMKFAIEIEPDDFNSSKEWNNFKEMIKNV